MDYKKYSLEQLENWIHNAVSCSEASPQEIYDTIKNIVKENYYTYKNHSSRYYELLTLLNGNGKDYITFSGDWSAKNYNIDPYGNKVKVCDKDDKSPDCQKAWNDFWEENYYPEEYQKHSEKVKDNGMRPWGHSDMEYLVSNPKQEINYSKWYTTEELNAMCDAAEKQDKVVKWQLPVEVDGLTGDCFIQFPDDLLEAADLKEGDTVTWFDRKDGSFELRKVTKPIGMEEC
jgi:hypothetical protein